MMHFFPYYIDDKTNISSLEIEFLLLIFKSLKLIVKTVLYKQKHVIFISYVLTVNMTMIMNLHVHVDEYIIMLFLFKRILWLSMKMYGF